MQGVRVQCHMIAWFGCGSRQRGTRDLLVVCPSIEMFIICKATHQSTNRNSSYNGWNGARLDIAESSSTSSESTENECWSFNSLIC